ncbi:MAG TPA: glycosyltransferase family 39 protein [Candidatus Limnocylindrales bacterium]|nr:glycosyltransferase family 39 protein [Candidatus Limnocylindrales bacterium]
MARLPACVRDDRWVLVGLLALAAVLRLADLPTRGTWDADQGHDMLVLRAFVVDGQVPLLGPPTSIGDVHHGAWYYYLLAPAAALGGAAPEVVVGAIAMAGVAAVGVTWWVGRFLGGSVAGFVAGLAMTVSVTAIEESTFIWNPNLIPLASALALAGMWRAWATRRARWWLLAFAGVVVTMQLHVLGVVLLPPVVAVLVADARRRPTGPERAAVLRAGLGGLAVLLVVAYTPLVVNELTTGFSETQALLAYLRDGGEPVALDPLARILFVGIRGLSWPLTGLVTDALVAAVVASAAVIAILAWRSRAAKGSERTAARWMAATLAWSTIVLALAAPSLATVTPGLPNDHYHSFLDPLVFVVVGMGAGALWRAGGDRDRSLRTLARGAAAIGVGALVTFNILRLPPPVAPDEGWPAARDAADRIGGWVGDRPVALLGLPELKPADAIGFPLVDRGVAIVPAAQAGALVVVCDRLFEAAIGAACGGPAEDAAVGPPGRFAVLVDRFDVSPRTSVSVYLGRDE